MPDIGLHFEIPKFVGNDTPECIPDPPSQKTKKKTNVRQTLTLADSLNYLSINDLYLCAGMAIVDQTANFRLKS